VKRISNLDKKKRIILEEREKLEMERVHQKTENFISYIRVESVEKGPSIIIDEVKCVIFQRKF
jgi:hypothetical protein